MVLLCTLEVCQGLHLALIDGCARTFYVYLGHPVTRLQHKHLPQHVSRESLEVLELHTCAGHGRPMVKFMGSTDSDPIAGKAGGWPPGLQEGLERQAPRGLT